mmetsp:Transcript_18798/g.27658  ORF Transcript_18798/g.27658 Transcript_18798/m.27658 type:complete len:160 (-) Transcript_18798:110-589(-)
MGRCHSTKIALMFAQPIFQHLCTELGEVPETRVTRVRSTALWEGRCARFPAGKSALNLLKTTQTMVLQDGPNGRVLQQQLKFTKATSTGQVYIDAWGSQVVTAGWPQQRPNRGQVGEVLDIKTVFAGIRYTRTSAAGSAPAFGCKQQGGGASLPQQAQM